MVQEACGVVRKSEEAETAKQRRLSRYGTSKRIPLEWCGVLPSTPAF